MEATQLVPNLASRPSMDTSQENSLERGTPSAIGKRVTDKPSQPVVLARFGCFSLPCSESSSLLYSLSEMILRLVLSILLKLFILVIVFIAYSVRLVIFRTHSSILQLSILMQDIIYAGSAPFERL